MEIFSPVAEVLISPQAEEVYLKRTIVEYYLNIMTNARRIQSEQ
jgi:hypothetical protein